MRLNFLQLILVTNKNDKPLKDYLDFIEICIKSGITSIQLREKKLPYYDKFVFGEKLRILSKSYNIPLIINDDVKLAYELNADGVHLGQSDGDVIEARKILGKDKIIGLTIDSIEQIYQANILPIDYVGVGAIFPSTSKKDIKNIWGCNGLKKLALLSKPPIVAIGGINETNINKVMQSGASGVAAINVFHEAGEISKTIKNLLSIIRN